MNSKHFTSGENTISLENIQVCIKQRQYSQVLDLASAADESTKQHFLYWYLLGIAQFHLKQFAQASESFVQARNRNPQQPQVLLKLIDSLLHGAQFEQAYVELSVFNQQFSTLLPKDWFRLGLLQHQLNLESQSLVSFRQAYEAEPSNNEFAYNYALSLKNCGRLDHAKKVLTELLLRQPNHVDSLNVLALLNNAKFETNYTAQLQSVLLEKPCHNEIKIRFSLAKCFEDKGDFDKAFEQLSIANKTRSKQQKYRIETDIQLMKSLQVRRTAPPGSNIISRRPIFIVSLPRSGSTLLERILTQPESVASGGELLHFSAILSQMVNEHGKHSKSQSEFIAATEQIPVQTLGEKYLAATNELAKDADFLVDKMPLNFLNVGLIKRALPGAKVIYIQRHPLDNVMAIYKTLFEQAYPYAYSLEDIALYLANERQLMQFWMTQFPEQIHCISYEHLVREPEIVACKLFAHCNIPFKTEYLELERNNNAAATASAAQVRGEIYQSSVETWRHYESQLQPAIEVLNSYDLV